MSIQQISPILTIMLAPLFLPETITCFQIVAVRVGFSGVICIAKPTFLLQYFGMVG